MTGKDVYLQMTWSWPDKTWNILCSYCLQWNTSQSKFRNHYFLFLFAFSILSQLFLIWGCTWPPQLLGLPQPPMSSALLELYPLVVAALLWGKEWSATSIIIHCDNEATVHCINKGRSHSPALMPLLRRLIWISACDQFIITAKHIPGSKNLIADSLSRFAFQKFRTLAPEADPLPTPVPPYSELIFL